ncbi:MAG TPA: hypothetical protein PLN85_01230 [archaeon]|nr:hypothetical protein [archaeon]
MSNMILVIYVGVANIRLADIEDFVKKVTKKITPERFEGEIIVIPTNTIDTKIECINPRYVTEEALIKEHNEMMKKLNNLLNYQINELENENK